MTEIRLEIVLFQNPKAKSQLSPLYMDKREHQEDRNKSAMVGDGFPSETPPPP